MDIILVLVVASIGVKLAYLGIDWLYHKTDLARNKIKNSKDAITVNEELANKVSLLLLKISELEENYQNDIKALNKKIDELSNQLSECIKKLKWKN